MEKLRNWLTILHKETRKKSTKCRNDLHALALRNDAKGYKINEILSGLLVYLWVMPSTERLSSKFHNCPQIFASRQTVHQQSISLGHYPLIYQLLKGVYLLNRQQKHEFLLLYQVLFFSTC